MISFAKDLSRAFGFHRRWPRCLLATLMLASCTPPPDSPPTPARQDTAPIHFTDVTESSGVRFQHFNDSSPRRLLPETMGSGGALFDYDGDGLADAYLVNGAPLVAGEAGRPTGALYRNLGQGRFEDVTAGSGLEETFYGMGAAVGDFDNDGDVDLFVTGVGEHHLFANLGGGRFRDVTREMGIDDRGFGSSAAFLDYDKDGFLDLFVARYVEWSVEKDLPCNPDGRRRTYCTPEQYPGVPNLLYRNLNGSGFADVSSTSGIGAAVGKALGVAVLDHNRDGWPDIAVANDTVRNFLFLNQQNGAFAEIGVEAGLAYSESGATRGGMGIDSSDIDGDGFPDILVGNFSQEMAGLFHGTPNGYYIDEAAQLGVGIPTLMTLAFGAALADFNGDGQSDILLVNGHIEPDIAETRRSLSYAQPPQLFLNDGRGGFHPVPGTVDGAFLPPLVARGLATADIDLDGDLDLLITQNGREARLIRNDNPPSTWLRLVLKSATGCATPYGATVTARTDRDRTFVQTVRSGRSYLSASEPVVTLSVAPGEKISELEVTWPDGRVQALDTSTMNQAVIVQEKIE